MSKTITSVSLSNVLFQLKKTRIQENKMSIPIDNGPFPSVLFQSGVTVFEQSSRQEASGIAAYSAYQARKDNQKILHICLEEYLDDISLNYLSLFTDEKVRSLKNPNFRLDKIEQKVAHFTQWVELVPLKSDKSLWGQMMTEVEEMIKTHNYAFVIFEGMDKMFSKDQRAAQVAKFLKTAQATALSEEVVVACVFKAENFPKVEGIHYVSAQKNTNQLLVDDKVYSVMWHKDWVQYFPAFQNYPKLTSDELVVGLDLKAEKYLSVPFNELESFGHNLFENQRTSFVNLLCKLNQPYVHAFSYLSEEENPDLEIKNQLTEPSMVSAMILRLFFEMDERQKKKGDKTLAEYEQNNSPWTKELIFSTLSEKWLKEHLNTLDYARLRRIIKDGSQVGLVWVNLNGLVLNKESLYNSISKVQQSKNTEFHRGYSFSKINLLEKVDLLSIPLMEAIVSPVKEENRVLAFTDESKRVLTTPEFEDWVEKTKGSQGFCLGFEPISLNFNYQDMMIEPGCLILGPMGSGKTESVKTIAGLFLANHPKAVAFNFFSPERTFQKEEYSLIKKKFKNWVDLESSEKAFLDTLLFLEKEMYERKKIIKEKGLNHYREMGLNEILVIIENFDELIYSSTFNFDKACDDPGTPAGALNTLFRVGRSLGINFLLTGTASSMINSKLRPGISNVLKMKSYKERGLYEIEHSEVQGYIPMFDWNHVKTRGVKPTLVAKEEFKNLQLLHKQK